MDKNLKSNLFNPLSQIIITNSSEIIIILDDAFKVILFNPTAERIFNCPANEVIGMEFDKLISLSNFEISPKNIRDEILSNTIAPLKIGANHTNLFWTAFHLPVDNTLFFVLKARVEGEKDRAIASKNIAEGIDSRSEF
jgi:PAS domain-containing protein